MKEGFPGNTPDNKENSFAEKGAEAARLVEKLYNKLPPALATHLVESNVVLTLAGLKGQTEFYINISSEKEAQDLTVNMKKVNELFGEQGGDVVFYTSGKFFSPAYPPEAKETQKVIIVNVYNTEGLKRLSTNTKIPGIVPYDKSSGTTGILEWQEKILSNLEEAQKEGKLPAGLDEEGLYDIVHGLIKGYPDRAILDAADAIAENKDWGIMEDSKIPLTGMYKEAQPNYDFYPEHADDPGIKENVQQAGDILKAFYESGWHKRVSADGVFLNSREENEKRVFVKDEK